MMMWHMKSLQAKVDRLQNKRRKPVEDRRDDEKHELVPFTVDKNAVGGVPGTRAWGDWLDKQLRTRAALTKERFEEFISDNLKENRVVPPESLEDDMNYATTNKLLR